MIPATVASVVKLRRTRKLLTKPHIATTLNIRADYLLEQLLHIVFLVRGDACELVVESQYPAIVGLMYELDSSSNPLAIEISDVEESDTCERETLRQHFQRVASRHIE